MSGAEVEADTDFVELKRTSGGTWTGQCGEAQDGFPRSGNRKAAGVAGKDDRSERRRD